MKHIIKTAFRGVLPVGLLCMGGLVGSAQASKATESEARQQLDGWSQRIVALSAKETGKTAGDIERLRSLLSQGQAFVASEKLSSVGPVLERMDALEGYVQSKQARLAQEGKAAAADAALKAAQTRLAEITAAASAAKKTMDKLEAKGL